MLVRKDFPKLDLGIFVVAGYFDNATELVTQIPMTRSQTIYSALVKYLLAYNSCGLRVDELMRFQTTYKETQSGFEINVRRILQNLVVYSKAISAGSCAQRAGVVWMPETSEFIVAKKA